MALSPQGNIIWSCLVLLGLFAVISVASDSFDVYPLTKYARAGQDLGTAKSSFSFIATSYHKSYDESASRSRAILLPYQVSGHLRNDCNHGSLNLFCRN